MKTQRISVLSRVVIFIAAAFMAVSVFVPIWRIELDAPQYPEGLALLIYADKIAGDVNIINGLNHYIGMATLHTENFVEFKVLPYIIWGFVALFVITAIVGRKKLVYTSFGLFLTFGILSMIDFWRWEYEYGHNLDPNAAIIVPGMAYQPPLIGFKQLLNFGAFSIPTTGGWLLIASGLLILIALLYETGLLNKIFKSKKSIASLFFLHFILSSCSQNGPVPIELHKDDCHFCKMSIADGRFGAELITDKGRVYKFDDVSCLIRFKEENATTNFKGRYVCDYNAKNNLIDISQSYFVYSEKVRSPMRGDIAAFSQEKTANEAANKWKTKVLTWGEVEILKK